MSKMSKAIAVLGVVAGLGVAALPLSSYAEGPYAYETSTFAKVTTTVEGAVSISTTAENGTVALGDLTPGGDVKTGSLTVTVKSNESNDFDLNMTATDMTANGGAYKINRGTPQKSTSAWGYSLGDSTDYVGIPAAGVSLNKTGLSAGTADAKGTIDYTQKVNFAASADSSQDAGDYSATVTFTAAVK